MRKNTLRYRLLVALCLLLTPACILAFFLSLRLLEETKMAKARLMAGDILASTLPILDDLQAGERLVLTLTSMNDLWRLSPAECTRRITQLRRVSPMTAGIALVKADGQVHCSVPTWTHNRPLIDVRRMPPVTGQGVMLVADIEKGDLTNVPAIGVYLPIVRDKAVIGLVWVSLRQDRIAQALARARQRSGLDLRLESASGAPILTTSMPQPPVDSNHRRRVALYRDTVFVSFDEPRFWDVVRQSGLALPVILSPLLVWLLTLGTVWLTISRLAVTPIEKLRHMVERRAAGDSSQRAPLSYPAADELIDLAGALNAMADAAEAREASLSRLLADQQTLVRELHHRVRNNLQILSSMISLDRPHERSPEVAQAMLLMQQRIDALTLAHNVAFESATLTLVPMGDFLRRLSAQLGHLPKEMPVALSVDIAEPQPAVPIDSLIPLALITIEIRAMVESAVPPGTSVDMILRARTVPEGIELVVTVPRSIVRSDDIKPDRRQVVWRYLRAYTLQLRGKLETRQEDLPALRLIFNSAGDQA